MGSQPIEKFEEKGFKILHDPNSLQLNSSKLQSAYSRSVQVPNIISRRDRLTHLVVAIIAISPSTFGT